MDADVLLPAAVAALNQADWPALEPLLVDEIVFDDERGTRHLGRAAFREAWIRRAAEGETISDLVVMRSDDGSRAAAEFTLRGRRRGREPEDFSVPAGAFLEIEDGRIGRISLRLDAASLERSGPATPDRA